MLRCEMVGMKFIPGAVAMLRRLNGGDELELIREPNNEADPNAVAIYYAGAHIGYVPRAFNWNVGPMLDRGTLLKCTIQSLSLGLDGKPNCEILIERVNDDD